eukprot:CAMPEP_0201691348 /NCGR_PEP_ID=MMETSP0578-20130828/4525_1 /ASSEMBLY_ACC=CAM_ASM_000663 /TAXON_ID=267565 /ORGANISM="Skeletonema grethea, Strain CCMP 1804" /LENGTH=87 /DNA_ID=CAMNT_0048176531 /DNA_START=56 /DNA_END=319 /DNA_ORIENTATION=-
MKLNFLATAAINVIVTNTGTASAASLRGIVPTFNSDFDAPVLAADAHHRILEEEPTSPDIWKVHIDISWDDDKDDNDKPQTVDKTDD